MKPSMSVPRNELILFFESVTRAKINSRLSAQSSRPFPLMAGVVFIYRSKAAEAAIGLTV